MRIFRYEYQSPVGKLFLEASETGLRGLYFRKPEGHFSTDPSVSAIILKTVDQLEEYFRGERRNFDVPLEAGGTEFQKKVWGALSEIPYGKTCSYTSIARKIKNDKAVRAVGTANGANPISIIVPCHRVIAADGTLGGYGGGLEIKSRLLEIEHQ